MGAWLAMDWGALENVDPQGEVPEVFAAGVVLSAGFHDDHVDLNSRCSHIN